MGAIRSLTDRAGAGEGNRTLVVSLEGFCSTIELHPQTIERTQFSLGARQSAQGFSNSLFALRLPQGSCLGQHNAADTVCLFRRAAPSQPAARWTSHFSK